MLNINDLLIEAKGKITAVKNISDLEKARVEYLGKKGTLTLQLKQMGTLSVDKRRELGQSVNSAKKELETLIAEAKIKLEEIVLYKTLKSQAIDVTLPARSSFSGGGRM